MEIMNDNDNDKPKNDWLDDFHAGKAEAMDAVAEVSTIAYHLYHAGQRDLSSMIHACTSVALNAIEDMDAAVDRMINDRFNRGREDLGRTLTTILKSVTKEGKEESHG